MSNSHCGFWDCDLGLPNDRVTNAFGRSAFRWTEGAGKELWCQRITMKYVCFALICFLTCINGVLFDTQSTENKEQITFKIGGNITLTVPAEDNAVIEVERVSWAKKDNALFKTSKNNPIAFLNEQYKPRVYSCNESLITIFPATREDEGMYTAQIRYRNTSTNNTFSKTKWYYVVKLPVPSPRGGICDRMGFRLLAVIQLDNRMTGVVAGHQPFSCQRRLKTPEDETEVVEPKVTPGYNRTYNDPPSSDNTGAIAGIIVCLFIFIFIFIIILICVYKKKCKQKKNNENGYNHEQNERTSQVMISSVSIQQHSSGNNTKYDTEPQEENTSQEMVPLYNHSHQNEEGVKEEE
ncbi:uncharacterized protein [Aquarana catesbeiana]|uniref:uncharacterized protein n=1 Tax=Aquarana catesbeiana TaxID=8400 RepID=UPI003CC9FA51